MPGLTTAKDSYQNFFKKCLKTRLDKERFGRLFQQLHARSPVPSSSLASYILSSSVTGGLSDPVFLEYLEWLLSQDHLTAAQVLSELLKTSALKPSITSPATVPDNGGLSGGREALEADVMLVITKVINSKKPRSSESVWTSLQSLSDWMEAVMASPDSHMMSETTEAAMPLPTHVRGRLEALGELVIAFTSQEDVARILGDTGAKKDRRLAFQASLSLYVQFVQIYNVHLGMKLEGLRQQQQQAMQSQRHGSGKEVLGKGAEIDRMMMGLGDEAAVPVVWTRAHLYVWLSSLLAGKPHVDEDYVVGYLFSRYKDLTNEMLVDFLTAVLDVVTYSLSHRETSPTLVLMRSFLVNKVPLLLLRLSPNPQISSFAITQAFMRADTMHLTSLATSMFDPYSTSTNDDNDLFSDIQVDLRSDFLFGCALHGIIHEADINTILQELPVSAMPTSGKYTVQMLHEQCAHDPSRVDRLLEEIEVQEGNSGAVCKTLFDILKNMIENRETLPLRNICSWLTRKTSSLDILFLFIKPAELLEPLCDLLDTWRYEDDQGEYQPVYEEFGSVLLLVLTIIYRYNIPSPSGLSYTRPLSPTSFIPSLLTEFTTPTPITSLNPDRYATLGGWVKELFEGEGISDSLMSSCTPQEFYYLIPTLFSQTLSAVTQSVLDLDTVTEAFKFLHEPFLLPSVVSGLFFLSHKLWSTNAPFTPPPPSTTPGTPAPAAIPEPPLNTNFQLPLTLIHTLISPPSSRETSEVHRTAISIPSRALSTTLTTLLPSLPPQLREPTNQILARLRPLLSFQRSATPTKDELTEMCHPTIATTFQAAFAQLVQWSPHAAPPPKLFSPKLLNAATTILGARGVVNSLLHATERIHKLAAANPAGPQHTGEPEDVIFAVLMSYLPDADPSLIDAARAILLELDACELDPPTPPAPKSGDQNVGTPGFKKASLLRTVLHRIDTLASQIEELGRNRRDVHVVDSVIGVDSGQAEMGMGMGMEVEMGGDDDGGMGMGAGMGAGLGGEGMGEGMEDVGMGMEGMEGMDREFDMMMAAAGGDGMGFGAGEEGMDWGV